MKDLREEKIKTLTEIAEWNEKVASLQNKKADLEREILSCDIELNVLMGKYDELCRKLLGKVGEVVK